MYAVVRLRPKSAMEGGASCTGLHIRVAANEFQKNVNGNGEAKASFIGNQLSKNKTNTKPKTPDRY